eukprot:6325572-Prymnesium_polylepis.1
MSVSKATGLRASMADRMARYERGGGGCGVTGAAPALAPASSGGSGGGFGADAPEDPTDARAITDARCERALTSLATVRPKPTSVYSASSRSAHSECDKRRTSRYSAPGDSMNHHCESSGACCRTSLSSPGSTQPTTSPAVPSSPSPDASELRPEMCDSPSSSLSTSGQPNASANSSTE